EGRGRQGHQKARRSVMIICWKGAEAATSTPFRWLPALAPDHQRPNRAENRPDVEQHKEHGCSSFPLYEWRAGSVARLSRLTTCHLAPAAESSFYPTCRVVLIGTRRI